MHLHEARNGETIEDYYTVEGTPYTVHAIGNRSIRAEVRRGPEVRVCFNETRELHSRYQGRAINQDLAVEISEWLQGVWAKHVNLALTIGEVP